MKIISLTAENIKRLKAVHIEPKEDVVLITGKNAAGKSSVLDSIVMALGGKDEIPEKPIREGQEAAKIVLDLDDIIVTRKFTATGTYLEVKTKDGFVAKSPQQLLDNLVGKISFDPLAFINEDDPKKQRKILLDLLGLNLDAQDAKIAGLRSQRRDVGRDRDQLDAQLKGMTKPAADLPPQEINIAGLSADLSTAIAQNDVFTTAANDLTSHKTWLQAADINVARLEQDVVVAKQGRDGLVKKVQELEVALAQMQTVDTTAIAGKMQSAEATNQAIRSAADYYAKQSALKARTEDYEAGTKAIESAEAEKVTVLTSAKMPLEGLSVTEAGVTYKGIPIEQISSAEKLRVGVAMSMALNPKLRVLRITDGSLLDGDNLKAIAEMVKDKDYQIWVEKVTDGAGVGVYIEDGEVK